VTASPRARSWLAGLALAAAAILPYLSTLHAGFVFDDHALVEGSAALRGPLWNLWLGRGVYDWWPLTWTSLWIDFRLFGLDPTGYHAVNVALHAGTALLLWRILLALRVPGAWLGAVLFAVHPVTVESVAWISERKNVLSGVFFTASILAWLRFDDSGTRRTYAASIGLFLLALLAKTSVVMLPVVLLLLALFRRQRLERRDVVRTLPFFALSLALGLVTVWYQWTRAVGEQTGAPRGLLERVGASGWALASYAQKAFLPVDLGLVYPEWPVVPSSPWFWIPTASLAAAATGGVWLWRRRRSRWLIAFAYHAVMVLPVLGLVEIAYFYISPVANHLQYLALMGPAALVGTGISSAMKGRFRTAAMTAAVVSVSTLALFTSARALAFQSDKALWAAASREQPGALFSAWSYSDILGGEGQTADALAVLSHLERSAPDEPSRVRARALRAFHERRYEAAAAETLVAWQALPVYVFQASIGDLLVRAGQSELAIAVLSPLLDVAPAYADARYSLALAQVRSGRRPEAAETLRRGLAIDPSVSRLREALDALRPVNR
jgi:protein O-mannosyl-transferase